MLGMGPRLAGWRTEWSVKGPLACQRATTSGVESSEPLSETRTSMAAARSGSELVWLWMQARRPSSSESRFHVGMVMERTAVMGRRGGWGG